MNALSDESLELIEWGAKAHSTVIFEPIAGITIIDPIQLIHRDLKPVNCFFLSDYEIWSPPFRDCPFPFSLALTVPGQTANQCWPVLRDPMIYLPVLIHLSARSASQHMTNLFSLLSCNFVQHQLD
jgi:hypothetical protein